MELDWSTQSPHIRTLFHPWQPGDGYDEAEIEAAEARLGLRLPATRRNFYLACGRRTDLTAMNHGLLSPDHLEMRENTLLFWEENQAVWYWGVHREVLEEADPPVALHFYISAAGRVKLERTWEPIHPQLSFALDDMVYHHAFVPGGAIHGGWTRLSGFHDDMPAGQVAWLEEEWSKAIVTPLCFGMDVDLPREHWPTLYVRDGQAFWVLAMAAREAEALDEIGQRFRFPWQKRW